MNSNRNTYPSSPLEQAAQAAEALLIAKGEFAPDQRTVEVEVPITYTNLTKVPDGVTPNVTVRKPVRGFAEESIWDYTITYDTGHGESSRHIIIYKNRPIGTRIMSQEIEKGEGGTRSVDRPLNSEEEIELANDLTAAN